MARTVAWPVFSYAFAIKGTEPIMDKRLWFGLILAGCSAVTVARDNLADIRKQAEASLLATGTINVEPDGSVSSFTLDQPNRLPTAVVSLVDTSAPRWRFEPVIQGGKPIKAKARMSLHFIARKSDDTHYQVSLDAASFGEGQDTTHSANETSPAGAEMLRPAHRLTSPQYPFDALASGVGGVAYVVLRINRQGTVADAIVEQVNLRAVASEVEMARFRTDFAQSALKVARHWTFITPTGGETANAEFWTG